MSVSTTSSIVPARAAEWIGRVLREALMPAMGSLQIVMEDHSVLDMKLLSVKQLKCVSNEMVTRTVTYRNNNPSCQIQNLVFIPPKSNCRKAERVSAIAAFFHAHNMTASNSNIYNILNGTPAMSVVSAASASAVSTKRSSPERSSPRNKGAEKSAAKMRLSPTKAYAKRSSPAAKKSPTKRPYIASMATKHSPTKRKSASASSTNALMAADEALARSLQNQIMQEGIGHFMTQSNPLMGSNGYPPWAGPLGGNGCGGGPLANSHLSNNAGNTTADASNNTNVREPVAQLERPANDNDINGNIPTLVHKPKSDLPPKKVKSEPPSHTATYHPTHSSTAASAAASSASTSDDSLQPRDTRESSMVGSLHEMGFMDAQEILTALRAVAAQREEVSIVSAPNETSGAGWSSQEQAEAAMMWIVSQREEAAEAQKLDEARISSELADAAMEQSRKHEMERELNTADSVDLLGSVEEDVEIKSKHFPCSALLRNRSVKSVLKVIASVSSPDKVEVIRLLTLEKKARKWYGTVLPFSYFGYVLCPRFEGWAKDFAPNSSTITLCQNVRVESVILERAMFNLAEQEEGGVGMVPKLFLAAQRDATAKGKSTSAVDDRICNDDDVEVMQLPSPSSAGRAGGSATQSVEVIDIT